MIKEKIRNPKNKDPIIKKRNTRKIKIEGLNRNGIILTQKEKHTKKRIIRKNDKKFH
jgi:hypothetical protein